jgi:hypothetical protein
LLKIQWMKQIREKDFSVLIKEFHSVVYRAI